MENHLARTYTQPPTHSHWYMQAVYMYAYGIGSANLLEEILAFLFHLVVPCAEFATFLLLPVKFSISIFACWSSKLAKKNICRPYGREYGCCNANIWKSIGIVDWVQNICNFHASISNKYYVWLVLNCWIECAKLAWSAHNSPQKCNYLHHSFTELQLGVHDFFWW